MNYTLRKDEFSEILKYCENKKKIAVVGCFNYEENINEEFLYGYLTKRINKKETEIIGFDKNKKGIKKLKKIGFNCKAVDFEKKINFKPEFDVVISAGMISHCMNLGIVLDNFKKMLKPNGLLLITENNTLCSMKFKDVLLGKELPRIRKIKSKNKTNTIGRHLISFSTENFRNLIEAKGFEFKKYVFFDNYNGILSQIRRLINYFRPELKSSFLLIAKK